MSRLSRKIKNLFSSNPRSFHDAASVNAHEIAFYKNFLREGMIAFDIGSNVGDLAALFSRCVGRTGRVHCFEPGEEAFARLSSLVSGLESPNVVLNRKAVGELVGKTRFHIYPESHNAWNSRARRPLEDYGIDIAPPTVQEVDCTTVDDYCAQAGISAVDLLKVDVEGAELQVFYGCRRLLAARRIRCCTFEFGQTTFDMGNQPAQIEAFFREVPYDLHNLIPGDPLFPGGQSARTAQFAMLMATPKPS